MARNVASKQRIRDTVRTVELDDVTMLAIIVQDKVRNEEIWRRME